MSPLDTQRDVIPGAWLLRYAMINLTGCLLLFGTLLLLAYYMQEGGIYHIEQERTLPCEKAFIATMAVANPDIDSGIEQLEK